MAQPENFAIFQPLVAATLWLAARGLRGDRRAYALAGLLVGVASIARNDAFLLGGAIGLVFVVDRLRAWRGRRPPALPICGCHRLLRPVPPRRRPVVGAPVERIRLDLADGIERFGPLADLLSAMEQHRPPTPRLPRSWPRARARSSPVGSSASWRPWPISRSSSRPSYCCRSCAWGAWRRRGSGDFVPWFLYVGIMFAGATLIFPLHVPGGAFIHSAVGMAPHAYILALEGVAATGHGHFQAPARMATRGGQSAVQLGRRGIRRRHRVPLRADGAQHVGWRSAPPGSPWPPNSSGWAFRRRTG